jgi:hypothetical protein
MGDNRNKFPITSRFPGTKLIHMQFLLNGTSNPLTGSGSSSKPLSGALGPVISGSTQLAFDSFGQNGGVFGQPVRQGNGYGMANGTGSINVPLNDKYLFTGPCMAQLIMPASSASLYSVQVVSADACGVNGAPSVNLQVVSVPSGSNFVPTAVDLTQNQAAVSLMLVVGGDKASTGH